ncbi:expressed unknown protein [Seminavis robusta]|uniref:Uncharacterized protein n=1 Tax=Seminavis robusta TaxID=568900 RepID=A0A9N8HWA8_9STRA|nr:expressed unknown protein [Seminavis robusta]|eukprot:Sro1625_g286750.1 n/a (213) ;mRNA; f:9607-10245
MTSYRLIGGKQAIANDGEDVEQIKEMMKDGCLQMSRCCSLIIGFIIGCFIQCSTLGANFMMTTLYGKEVYFTETFIVISLAWCFVTSIMGVAVLLFLRSLVVTAFYATNTSRQDEAVLEAKENYMVQVIENIEQFFAVGSLVGVGSAWTVTDILLGMQSHVYHSLLTVCIALIWCKCAMKHSKTIAKDEKASIDNNDLSTPLVGKEVVIQVV